MLHFPFCYSLLLFLLLFNSPCSNFILSFSTLISYWTSAPLTLLLFMHSSLLFSAPSPLVPNRQQHPLWEARKWWKPQLETVKSAGGPSYNCSTWQKWPFSTPCIFLFPPHPDRILLKVNFFPPSLTTPLGNVHQKPRGTGQTGGWIRSELGGRQRTAWTDKLKHLRW